MKKILVANRGEIALRVMKTAKRMGISTVAVYSEADRNAPHVKFADEAICLGPPPSAQSYLLGEKIIKEALRLGVDGIHPGYGFLSENADFAEKVSASGITFIGPRPDSVRIMGSKLAAKDAVKDFDVPLVPGTEEAVTDKVEARKIADGIGYPILVKASAGGGGKGMRLVERSEDFEEQLDRAVSEATSSFGDGSVFIEKFVTNPRHIEIQILADNYGNTVHLFERECSVQRRHQKVVEEAPSAILTEDLRKRMGASAVQVAQSVNYTGAGTVEFLVDDHLNYYFLEMNTRLQVEHPVTEMITGLDLVEQQIRVARGEKLAFSQEDLSICGHALELRVYAEDSYDNFMPSTGNLEVYIRPEGEGVRVDDGFEEGMDIPVYYDPMIAKLITYGSTRAEASEKMLQAIEDYKIKGPQTTLPFGRFVLKHDAFISGKFDTNFVKKYYSPEKLRESWSEEANAAALAGAFVFDKLSDKLSAPQVEENAAWGKR